MGAYRGLTITEIEQLKQQNCMADDWSAISVTKDFIPDHICHTRFSGQIKLGAQKRVHVRWRIKKTFRIAPRDFT